MAVSLFLAKLIGVYLLVATADMLLRKEKFEDALTDYASSKGLLLFSGSLSLVFGLAIIFGHPVYKFNWRIVITLIGYLLVIRGIARVAAPIFIQKRIVKWFIQGYWIICGVLLVLGFFLTYHGFIS
ncbi:MAG: hypothetical protein JSS30_03865 [Verrucomicrobia bacterium]|nr:hypothetical protein [Verrucomicrobiota bacterium]